MRTPSLSIVRFAALLTLMHATLANAQPTLTASATTGASDLTMDGAGSSSLHIVKVADLSLSTNDADGFILSVSSGNLTRTGGTSVPFQVSIVAHGSTAPTAGDFTVASGGTLPHMTSSAGAIEVDLYIKYQSANLQDPGPYSASISLSILDR
jgi:hypothetical protein